MAKKLNITPGLDLDSDDSITRADFTFWFTQALFGGIDREHFAAGSSPIVSSGSAPTSPTTGLVWHGTSTGAVSVWTGSEWLGVGLHIGATAPTSTSAIWADTTLDLERRYKTVDGIEGWHPVNGAYQLWTNRSGSTVAANRVVVRDTTGTSEREFTTTDVVKNQGVVGVTAESVDAGATGVIATVAGGATIDVLVDDSETDGAVAKGDGLVTYSVVGEARTVGPLNGNPYASQNIRVQGTPLGCFAEALGTKGADDLVKVRLLGHVGGGAKVSFYTSGYVVNSSETSTTTWADADLGSPASGTVIQDASHTPLVSAGLDVILISTTGGTGGERSLVQISPDEATTVAYSAAASGYMSPGVQNEFYHYIEVPLVDDPTSPTGLGELFSWQVTAYGAGTALNVAIRCSNYTY